MSLESIMQEAPTLLEGIYTKLFHRWKSTMATERVVHYPMENLGADVRVDREDASKQGYIFNATNEEIIFGFGVVPDNDPRAGALGTTNEPTIVGRADLVAGRLVPCRQSDADDMAHRLVGRHKQYREMDAAWVINTGRTYHPEIGGDGVCLFSIAHPHDHGCWSNMTGKPFSRATLIDVLESIARMVDYQGLRIAAKAELLVTSPDLNDVAAEAVKLHDGGDILPRLSWPHLNPGTWFIRTNVNGLAWFERMPFQMESWHDHVRNMQLVKGYERRCFTYVDPRAVHN